MTRRIRCRTIDKGMPLISARVTNVRPTNGVLAPRWVTETTTDRTARPVDINEIHRRFWAQR